MSETETPKPSDDQTSGSSGDTEKETPKPTETVDFWKTKAREQEKRAKTNADAATRLAEIEESQKSETQRLSDQATEADKRASEAVTEALRWRIAAKHRISDEDAETFLTGGDEDTLTRQAERLAAMSKPDDSFVPGPRPDMSQGARSSNGAQTGDPATDFAQFMSQPANG